MRNIRRKMLALLALLIGSLGFASVAAAQANACVSVLVGAGFAAKMRVVSGNFHTDWSGSTPIGKTACQPLSGVTIGNKFSVEVHAILGKTVTCTPADVTRVSTPSNIVYETWGTTLSVKCKEPGTEADADRDASALTINPDGQKAATAGDPEEKKH